MKCILFFTIFFERVQYFSFLKSYGLENLKGMEAELLAVSGWSGSKFPRKRKAALHP